MCDINITCIGRINNISKRTKEDRPRNKVKQKKMFMEENMQRNIRRVKFIYLFLKNTIIQKHIRKEREGTY